MTITIRLKTDNAAFEDRDTEVTRIVREWLDQCRYRGPLLSMPLRDVNGNTVGSVALAEE